MAGMIEPPISWSEIDVENALPSDPRPWQALIFALSERCAAAGIPIPIAAATAYYPSVAACNSVRNTIARLACDCFITIDNPRANGVGWNYSAYKWARFPMNVWPNFNQSSIINLDVDYPIYPPTPDSGHNMEIPAVYHTEGNADVYRTFLSDCMYWLDKMRYVNGDSLAERIHDRSMGYSIWADGPGDALARTTPSQLPGRGLHDVSLAFESTYNHQYSVGGRSGPYEIVAVNPAPLNAKAFLVIGFRNSSGNPYHEIKNSYKTEIGGTFVDMFDNSHVMASTEDNHQYEMHNGSWRETQSERYSASGVTPRFNDDGDCIGADNSNATSTRTIIKNRWNESGSRHVEIDRITETQDEYASVANRESKDFEYFIFDSFGIGDVGRIEPSVSVEAFSKAFLIDLASYYNPTIDPSGLETDGNIFAILSVMPHVVLDYHDAYKFKLDEES